MVEFELNLNLLHGQNCNNKNIQKIRPYICMYHVVFIMNITVIQFKYMHATYLH